jgi:hypothetical protein
MLYSATAYPSLVTNIAERPAEIAAGCKSETFEHDI